MIHILLKYKADVNIQDKNGFSPIMNLFRFPENYKLRLKVFKLLLAYGADVTLVDHRGITILYIICHCNAANNPIILEAVELLFKIGIDVNVKNELGHTALHIAVKDCKDIKVIKLLLKNGADPNIVDNWRKTPLHLICAQHYLRRFHLEIIQLLIQYKANVNAQNKDGYSPIMYLLCAPNNYILHLEVCKLLLENGVDVTLVDHEGNTVLHRIFEYNAEKNPIILAAVKLLIERGVDVNVRNGNGYSALHIAVEYCKDIKVIDLLLKNGADPNIVDNWGLTPLHFLCRRTAWTEVHSKLIQLLIQYKADPHVKSLQNISPIMYLFEHELLSYNEFILFMEIFGLLVKNGTDLKNVDVFSKSMLLHRILRCDHWGYLPEQLVEGLEFLLKNGADVNMKDNNGKTALHQAFHHTKHVAFLLKNGADPNITDVKGNIPLNYTFDNFHRYLNDHHLEHYLEKLLELLKLNVEHNADPSHVGGDGKTVLHSLIEKIRLFTLKPKKADWEAVSKFVHQYMEILLKHGLDVNIKDGDGFTALNLAVSHCNYDVTKILVEHGADANTVQFKGGLLENKEPQSLNLLTTLNVLAIIELWQSKGFRINNYQYLRLFKFLTLFEDSKINNDLHSLLPNFCHNVSPIICDPQWIDNFECGSGSVIRKYVETIFLAINDSSKCTNVNIATLKLVLYKTIKLHLSLVEYGNVYMDIETHNYLRNTLNSLVSEIPEIVQPRIFKGIRDQVDLAKEMINSNNISYLDLCTSSPDKTYSLLQKCDYESALNSEAFRGNVHDIGGIIRGYVIKALVRRFITQSTTDSIKLLFEGILPDLCCDKIVEFLDVIDLVSVFEAVINC